MFTWFNRSVVMVIGDESEFIAAILYDTPTRLPTQERMCRPMTTRARAEIDDEDDKHCCCIGLLLGCKAVYRPRYRQNTSSGTTERNVMSVSVILCDSCSLDTWVLYRVNRCPGLRYGQSRNAEHVLRKIHHCTFGRKISERPF